MRIVRNLSAFALSLVAGILLIVSGTHGPVALYQLILQELASITTDSFILSIAATIASILIGLSSFGGFIVMLGGFLIYRNHSRTGKLAIALGTGVGITWLLFVLFTLMTSGQVLSLIAQHSFLGWVGIALAFVAIIVAK